MINLSVFIVNDCISHLVYTHMRKTSPTEICVCGGGGVRGYSEIQDWKKSNSLLSCEWSKFNSQFSLNVLQVKFGLILNGILTLFRFEPVVFYTMTIRLHANVAQVQYFCLHVTHITLFKDRLNIIHSFFPITLRSFQRVVPNRINICYFSKWPHFECSCHVSADFLR